MWDYNFDGIHFKCVAGGTSDEIEIYLDGTYFGRYRVRECMKTEAEFVAAVKAYCQTHRIGQQWMFVHKGLRFTCEASGLGKIVDFCKDGDESDAFGIECRHPLRTEEAFVEFVKGLNMHA